MIFDVFEKYGLDVRQPKYWIPLGAYPFLLFIGYMVIDIANFETPEKVDESLVSKNEFNADLPSANIGSDLGDKMSMMKDQYGSIRDLTGVSTIESDADSLKQKEEYVSRYKEDEARAVREQATRDSLERELAKARKDVGSRRDQSSDEFTKELTAEERAKIAYLRQQGIDIDALEKELGISLSGKLGGVAQGSLPKAMSHADSVEMQKKDSLSRVLQNNQVVKGREVAALDESRSAGSVVKKVTETSRYFNTISANSHESNLIKAIVDEDVKGVSGSRIRLRLLDDVEVEGVVLPKGTYLYAELSGFSNQRVKASVKSVLVHDNIMKINLSVYDMDGMEGFYVPESAFRELVQDVGGQALSGGGMNVTENLTRGNAMANFASQTLQNTYQRVSQAISKTIRKNKVKLKYGSHVYLVNGQSIGRGSQGLRSSNTTNSQR